MIYVDPSYYIIINLWHTYNAYMRGTAIIFVLRWEGAIENRTTIYTTLSLSLSTRDEIVDIHSSLVQGSEYYPPPREALKIRSRYRNDHMV